MDWRDREEKILLTTKKSLLSCIMTTVYDSLKKKSASVITFGKE